MKSIWGQLYRQKELSVQRSHERPNWMKLRKPTGVRLTLANNQESNIENNTQKMGTRAMWVTVKDFDLLQSLRQKNHLARASEIVHLGWCPLCHAWRPRLESLAPHMGMLQETAVPWCVYQKKSWPGSPGPGDTYTALCSFPLQAGFKVMISFMLSLYF